MAISIKKITKAKSKMGISNWSFLTSNKKHRKKEKAIKNALTCQGWTSETKLSLLYDLVQDTESLPGDILEIGSAWGRSLVLFGLSSKKILWSVDPHTGGRAFIERAEKQNSFGDFLENIRKFDLASKVHILKNTTQEAIELQLIPKEVRFSLVFIDGLHTAEGVKIDFDFSYRHLVDRGMIVFDDYFEPSIPDYHQMINNLVHESKLEFVKDEISKLAYVVNK